jgi:hypothetical protein
MSHGENRGPCANTAYIFAAIDLAIFATEAETVADYITDGNFANGLFHPLRSCLDLRF